MVFMAAGNAGSSVSLINLIKKVARNLPIWPFIFHGRF